MSTSLLEAPGQDTTLQLPKNPTNPAKICTTLQNPTFTHTTPLKFAFREQSFNIFPCNSYLCQTILPSQPTNMQHTFNYRVYSISIQFKFFISNSAAWFPKQSSIYIEIQINSYMSNNTQLTDQNN